MVKNMKEYYAVHKDKIKRIVSKSIRKRRKEIKIEIYRLLGNKCIRCGFSDVRALQIDHVHGGGNRKRKERKSDYLAYYRYILKQIKLGSKDYQLLCANCNWIKRWENKEYYKKEILW